MCIYNSKQNIVHFVAPCKWVWSGWGHTGCVWINPAILSPKILTGMKLKSDCRHWVSVFRAQWECSSSPLRDSSLPHLPPPSGGVQGDLGLPVPGSVSAARAASRVPVQTLAPAWTARAGRWWCVTMAPGWVTLVIVTGQLEDHRGTLTDPSLETLETSWNQERQHWPETFNVALATLAAMSFAEWTVYIFPSLSAAA